MALRLPAGRALPVTAASAPAGLAARRSAAMASRSRALAAIGRHRLRAAAVPWSRARASPPALPLRASASPAPSPRGADRAGSTRARAVADVAETGAEVRTGGYPFADIEARWQKHWAENKTFATPDLVDTSKPKFYALDMFPYPRCAAYTTPGARRVPLLDRLMHDETPPRYPKPSRDAEMSVKETLRRAPLADDASPFRPIAIAHPSV